MARLLGILALAAAVGIGILLMFAPEVMAPWVEAPVRPAISDGPRPATSACYTPPVLAAAGPSTANQEVNDRASRAHRPSREPVERPADEVPGTPPRNATGDVYPGLGRCRRDLFLCPGCRHAIGRCVLMPATVIVGLQWGDEGKGKTTDFLAERTSMVVRYQGGDNAGHTVVRGDEVFKLRLTPSGVLYPHITSVIGNGVVVNPVTLIDELDMLVARGIDVERVRVSRSAHVIMPYHIALDQANDHSGRHQWLALSGNGRRPRNRPQAIGLGTWVDISRGVPRRLPRNLVGRSLDRLTGRPMRPTRAIVDLLVRGARSAAARTGGV